MFKLAATSALFVVLPLSFALSAGDGAAADINPHAIKLSYTLAKDNPIGLSVSRFAEIVAEKSGGKMKVTGYPDAQLGAEIATMSAAQGGVIEMTLISSAGAAGAVKEFAVFDLPFLFSDENEADAVVDGPVGKVLLGKLKDKGLTGLCYWEYGFRNLTNSKRPLAKAEDFAGLKLRTVQNRVYLDILNALGANATPMPFPEVYIALESRAIDGQDAPFTAVYSSRFYEVQKYLTATKHIYTPVIVAVSGKFWDKLGGDERKVLQDACDESRTYHRTVSREANDKVVAELKAKGMAFNEISPAERAKMKEKVKPVTDKYSKELGEDLVKQVNAEVEKVRKAK